MGRQRRESPALRPPRESRPQVGRRRRGQPVPLRAARSRTPLCHPGSDQGRGLRQLHRLHGQGRRRLERRRHLRNEPHGVRGRAGRQLRDPDRIRAHPGRAPHAGGQAELRDLPPLLGGRDLRHGGSVEPRRTRHRLRRHPRTRAPARTRSARGEARRGDELHSRPDARPSRQSRSEHAARMVLPRAELASAADEMGALRGRRCGGDRQCLLRGSRRARSRRRARRRRAMARVRLRERDVLEPLPAGARLSLPPVLPESEADEGRRRGPFPLRGRPRGPGRAELDRHRGPRIRHAVLALPAARRRDRTTAM